MSSKTEKTNLPILRMKKCHPTQSMDIFYNDIGIL